MDRLKPGYFFLKIIPILIFLQIFNFKVRAQESVSVPTRYQINYEVDEKGITQVTATLELFNPTRNVYISNYSIVLNHRDIENFFANDPAGPLAPTLQKKDEGTLVSFKFNRKVVGTEKPLVLSFRYTTRSAARKSGLVWEITLPKVADTGKLLGYNLTLTVPLSFGPPIFTSPPPKTIERKLTKTTFKFTSEPVAQSGAILSFGPYQIYSFSLKYHLKNPNLWKAQTKIALPPSIFGEQLTILDQITPMPRKVETDLDGNLLASYLLKGGKTLTVEVKGRAKIYNLPREIKTAGSFSEIPEALKKDYLSSQMYWDVGHPEVKKIIEQELGPLQPNSNVGDVAQKLFRKTVDLLKYDSSRIKPDLIRLGSAVALKNKERAVCMEFADLYITLLRQAGIPAQLLEGYAATADSSSRPVIGDVLHSWVRVYLPRIGWVATDPTWANTTGGLDYFSRLDTNHFVFVIKGLNSEAPYPAGAYKISPDQVGDIEVKVLSDEKDFRDPPPQLNYQLRRWPSKSLWNPLESYQLIFKNDGQGYLFSLKYSPLGLPTQNLGDLPPLGEISFDSRPEKILTSGQLLGRVSWLNAQAEVQNKEILFTKDTSEPQTQTNTTALSFAILLAIFATLGLLGFVLYRRVLKAGPRR